MSDFAENPLFPKPFTAKKKRNLRHFSPTVSCTRLRRIQELIQSDGNSRPKLDGILCILGVDGRYNSGSKQLLNYLLFGFCELLTSEISGGKITDEELEDVIILVKAASVHVYCNPLNYPYLLRYIAHWRNLQLHCLNKEEYDDNERAEEFKITSFISMVQGCEHIGVQYGEPSLGVKQPFDPFILEKWPLIQAYAFEDFGSGGFFTMKHKVIDVTGHLNSMYGSLDPAIVQNLIHETLPLFERHFKSVVTNVDAESHSELLKVTERTLSEPVVSYFTHGHITDKENSKRSTADCQPFVLLGSHSSRQNIKTSDRESSLNDNTTVGNSGINGNSAKHLVCFAVDPKGILKCARTCFLQNGFVPISVTDIGETSSLRHSKDLRLLINLYLLAIDAVMKGVETFSKTSDWQKSFSAVLSELKSGLEKRKIELMKSSFLSHNVEFSVDACDSLGRVVNLDKPHLAIKRVCLYLYDIPSIEHPGCTLGSVVFGETFLDSTIMKLVPGSMSENNHNSSFLLLTENIPRFVSWQGGGKEKEMSKQMEAFAKSKCDSEVLGKQLIYCGQVFVASPVNRWEAGCLYIYQQGFLFVHARLGVVLLPTSKLSRLQFQDMGDTSTMALLVLTYHPSIMDNLPPHLLTEPSYLVLAFTSDSHVYRQLYADVIHLWKDNQLPSFPPFETVTDLPEYLQESLSCLEKQHLHLSSAREEFLPSLKSFLRHLSVSSSFAEKPLQAEDLQILLGDKPHEPRKQLQDFELLLTVLTGAPQSGKDSLCRALMALAKENSKWLVWQRPEDNSDPFDPKVLQDSLATMLSSQRRLHTSGKRPRVIIVTPGFTDVMDVIRAVKTHPDAEVAKCLRIGAVTCCVDPLNCFMENRLTLPKLLEQCAQGWVNNVVFTRCLESQNPQLSLIQTLVRGCNPDVAFILAKGGEVTRTPDVELILSDSAFDESSMVQDRLLMCPGWSLGLFPSGAAEPPVSEIKVPFYAPLQKSIFAANLKALHGPISLTEIRQTGAVHSLQGRVCFSDEGPHKEVRVRWARLNGVLRMNTVENATAIPRPPTTKSQPNGEMNKAPEYYIIFTGFNLHEEALRDWLKTCCKPGPIKEKLKTRKDLSKDELTKISSAHKFDPLPPGWFYNGLHFVSLTGEKDYSHPLLETFIESYLMQINEEIKRRNLIVDHTPKVDIFTRP